MSTFFKRNRKAGDEIARGHEISGSRVQGLIKTESPSLFHNWFSL